jgi:predicted DNA-binding protein (MmcQ/YjbR family)
MNVDFVRGFCLSFLQSRESLQWGETLCFKCGAKVGGKIFAMLSLDAVPPTLTLKTTPERFLELIEIEGIVRARYVGRYHWVTLERLDVLRRAELEELISASYSMVAQKLPAQRKKATTTKGTKAHKGKPRRTRRR